MMRINVLLQVNGVYENIGWDVSSTYTSVRRPNGTTVRDEACSKQLLENMIFIVFGVSDCLFSDLKLALSRWTQEVKDTENQVH